MDKKNFNFFGFVYKIIRFLFLLPINIIKYFCIGFYFTNFVFIDIVLYAIIFVSFGVYKIIKYLCLFFTFPIVLYNILRKDKNEKCDISLEHSVDNKSEYVQYNNELEVMPFADNKVNEENNETDSVINIDEILAENELDSSNFDNFNENFVNLYIDEQEETVEEVPSIELVEEDNSFEPLEIIKNESEEVSVTNEIINEPINEETIKVKVPRPNYFVIGAKKLFYGLSVGIMGICFPVYKLFKLFAFGVAYISLGISKLVMYVSYLIYKIFKYFVFGIVYIMLIIGKIFIYISFVLYKLVKYLVLSLTLPIMIMNILGRGIEKNKEFREQQRLKKQEAKFKKQLMYQKKQEEKLRLAMERKQKKEKENEEYINENVKIEKKTFGQKFNDTLNKIFAYPGVLVSKLKKAYENSVFVKNSRNKRDMSRQALLIDFEGEDAEKSDVKLVYQYTAKNADGKIVTDYFEAFSKVEVHSFLLSEGYEVYNIKTNKWIQFSHGSSSTSKAKIKHKDLIFFLNQLSTYIKAGIPLVEALKILARQYEKQKKYQKLFRSIIYDLSMGESFSTALSKQGEAFPRILINMVKASEMTGELPEVLDDMSDYFTEMDKTRKQMITALMYPMIILIISVIVVTFILLFVIPKFVNIYQSMEAAEVPKFTLIVLAVSDFLKNNVVYLLIGIALFVLVIMYLYKNVKVFRTIMQWVMMHMPVFGNVIIYNEVTTFTKTFSSLLAHNVFITDSMEILNKITNNEIYKMLILDTITNLAKGEKISESFKDHWAFPVPAYEMLVTGERTGQLPEMMAKVSSYYQELHRNAVTRIKTFVEPVLIVFLTLIVGVIVLAIVVPMFGLYESVQSYG